MSELIAPKHLSRRRIILTTFFILDACVALDQVAKAWARHALANKNYFIGSSHTGFSLTFNSGSAFSLFQSSTFMLTIVGIVIATFLGIAIVRAKSLPILVSYSLILAGAVGNLLDRFFQHPGGGHGLVTDFIKVQSFPTFNVADSCVTIGAVLLIFLTFKDSKVIND